MIKRLFLFLFLNLALVSEAHSSPANSFIAENFQKVLPIEPSCQAQIKKLLGLHDSYEAAYKKVLTGANADAPKEILMQISGLLAEQETSSAVCFQDVSAVYASSVFQSGNRIETAPLDALFLMFLYKEGILKPLSKDQRYKLGGLWSQRSSNGFVLYGAYDCERSQIYFDPYKAPADLRGALEHELDHFYRDKLVKWDPRESSAISFLIADEVRATIYGSASAAQPLIAFVNHDKALHQREFGSRYRYFDEFDFDFHLFDRHGLLAGLAADWDWLGSDWMESPGSGPDTLTLLRSVLLTPDAAEKVDQMIEKIAIGYFGEDGKSIDKAEIRKILNRGDSDLSAFFRKVVRNSNAQPVDYSRQVSRIQNMSRVYDGEMPELKKVSPLFARALIEIRARAKVASPICRAVGQALQSGQLKNYLGNGIGAPGETTKPGGEGVKPGGEGVKPGGEGVKPAIEIRPCLSLKNGF